MDIPFIVGLKETYNRNYVDCNRAVYDGISRSLYTEDVEYGPNLIVKELFFNPFVYSGTTIYQRYMELKQLKHCGRAGIAEVQSLITLVSDEQLKPLVAKYGLFDESDQPWAEFYLDGTTNTVPKLIMGAINKHKYYDLLRFLMGDNSMDHLVDIHKLQEAVQAILPNHSVKIHKNLKQLFIRDYDDSARDILKRNGYKYTSKYGTTYMIGSDSYGRSLSLESLEDARKLVRHLGITDTHIITDEDNQIVVWIPKILVTTTFKYLDMIGVSGYVKQNGTVVMPYPKRGKTKGVKDD